MADLFGRSRRKTSKCCFLDVFGQAPQRNDPCSKPIGHMAEAQRTLKTDLHLHSSEDPADVITHDAYALIERAAALGFDAIALTLHDRQVTEPRLFDYARDRGITLIPGVERTIERRHVVLLNFAKGTDQVHTFSDLARLKSRGNGIVIAAHPFFPDRTCLRSMLDKHADLFDAVEWSYFWTGGLNFNRRAARWAAAHGKPVVGNSDLHDLRQLGRTCSFVTAERNPDAICEAIREGRVALHTSPVPKLELAQVLTGMFRRGNKPAAAVDRVRLATT
jgi:predicted metal-dependent phosphoesterase TrpH